ncbi:MAG: 8-oxoguanine DNA glycosylase, partial [Lachnospiraceae bacterium]|nr:8-oxoguanine DNA glycosylase [Lachnospiraceae bacterium]
TMNYAEARTELLKHKGIGPKVADCICLFGLHHIDAFPIDTHVKQLLLKYYPNGFDHEYFKGVAGVIQQYLFYYELMH